MPTTTTGTAQIVKMLRGNTGARDIRTVFTDFCEVSAIALRNTVDLVGWAAREKGYHRIADSYTAAQLDRFAAAFGAVALELDRDPRDVLGEVYMQLEISSKDQGQFFTPYPLALLIAQMQLSDVAQLLEERPFITVGEPAAGAGAMAIAVTQVLAEQGIDYTQRLHITADDISPVAVHMCFIQLSLLGAAAVVNRRNTLTQELFDSWPTPAHVVGGWAERLEEATATKPQPLRGS